MGASNDFILAHPTTGALPNGTHLLAFTGAQTAEGSPPGQEERSPVRRWILPALAGSEKAVTPIATDAVYETSGPDVTDGITANWLDLVVRSAPRRPAITTGD